MPDTVSLEKRSEVMRAVKSKDTALEVAFRSALWRGGLRFRVHAALPGKPDVVFPRQKIAVFVDSCFWHGCPEHCRMPKSNQNYWDNKIAGNRRRDADVGRELAEAGWLVIRLWEHELKRDLPDAVERVRSAVVERRQPAGSTLVEGPCDGVSLAAA